MGLLWLGSGLSGAEELAGIEKGCDECPCPLVLGSNNVCSLGQHGDGSCRRPLCCWELWFLRVCPVVEPE